MADASGVETPVIWFHTRPKLREGFSEVFAFLPQNVRVKTTGQDTGAPCPVCDALDRREVKHWSRDVPPFHPGCRCVVVAIDDASNFPPGWKGRQPRGLLS